jgi:ferric-dicitrate binding protein FerR (iron transport regulator)
MNTNNTNKDIEWLIAKHLSGEIQKPEQGVLDSWLSESAENQKAFEEYKKVWEKTKDASPVERVDVNAAWKRFEKTIDRKEENQIKGGKVIGLFSQKVSRIAAVVVLLIATGIAFYLYNHLSNPEIHLATTATEVKTIELPDGTKVTLNGNSTFDYRKKLGQKKREVHLDGEAYFEVARDETRPFIIESEETSVTVLGTKFNVNTHTKNESVEVVVNSGKVAFETHKGNHRVILEKGEKGNYSKTQKTIAKSANDDPNFLAWKTKKLIFDDKTLAYIVSTLNNVYHVNIKIENQETANCRMTATFNNQSLNEVLEVITLALDIKKTGPKDGIILKGDGC